MIVWPTIEDAIYAWVQGSSGLAADKVIWSQQEAPRPTGTWIAMRVFALRRIGQDWVDVVDKPLVLTDDDVESVATGTDALTLTAHSYVTGDGPVQLTTTGTLPAGLAVATDYWIIVVDADTIKLTAKFFEAINGTPVVDLTSAGSGTHTIEDTAETVRAGEEIEQRVRGSRELLLTLQCFAGTPTGAASSAAILDNVVTGASLPSNRAALNVAGVGIFSFGPVQSIDGLVGKVDFEPRATVDVRAHLAQELGEDGTVIEYAELENQDTSITTYVPEDPT